MTSLAEILLFLALSWPFLAGAALRLTGVRGPDNGMHEHSTLRIPFAITGLFLSVLDLLVVLCMAGTAPDAVHLWLDETLLAVSGSVILNAGLLTECIALTDNKNDPLFPAECARLFWTTGLVTVAIFLADPLAKIAVLLLASVLRTALVDAVRGRAAGGWSVMRLKASGALLVLSGLLAPGTSASGMLAGTGYAVLAGLFPATAYPPPVDKSDLPDMRDAGETFRLAAGALLLASVLNSAPSSAGSGATLSLALIGFGFVTLFITSLRMQSVLSGSAVRLRQGLNVSQICLALGAIAAGRAQPAVTCLALSAPMLTVPWLIRPEPARMSVLAGRCAGWALGLMSFMTVLFVLHDIATLSVVLTLVFVAILLPAVRRGGRDLLSSPEDLISAFRKLTALRGNSTPVVKEPQG